MNQILLENDLDYISELSQTDNFYEWIEDNCTIISSNY